MVVRRNVTEEYQLIVVGGSAGCVATAREAAGRAALRTRILVEPDERLASPDLVLEQDVQVGYGETLLGIDLDDDERLLLVSTNFGTYRAPRAVLSLGQKDSGTKQSVGLAESERITKNARHQPGGGPIISGRAAASGRLCFVDE